MQEKTPSATWEFYLMARKILGLGFMCKLLNVSKTQLWRYSRNPEFTADTERNPLDLMRLLFLELAEQGREDVAVTGLQMLAEPIRARVVLETVEAEPGPELAAGALDIMGNLNRVLELARTGDDPNRVDYIIEMLVSELRGYSRAYREEHRATCGAVRFKKDGETSLDGAASEFTDRLRGGRGKRIRWPWSKK